VSHLRTFGCVAHVKQGNKHLTKLEDRSTQMVFIGYESGSKAWRFCNPSTKRVHVSHDVVFEEDRAWDWNEEKTGTDVPFGAEFVPVESTIRLMDKPGSSSSSPSMSSSGRSGPPTHPGGRDVQDEQQVPTPGIMGTEYAPPTETPDLDADHEDDAPRRYRMLESVLGTDNVPEQAEMLAVEELLIAIGEEPYSVTKALKVTDWRKAMLEEMASIEGNKTWSLVDLPKGHRAIGLKWVYKLKRNELGAVIKHKARLVAKGYVQQQGIDFEEVFALVARMVTVRVLLAVATHNGWPIHHMDVKSAFLNGDLAEEVYVTQPPGFTAKGEEGNVLKLHKALYGFRQAPRAWNVKLDKSLGKLSFTRCKTDHGLYTRKKGGQRVVVGVYVDDMLIIGESDAQITEFKKEMKKEFEMTDLGSLSYYLGIEVCQTAEGLELKQETYAKKLLEKAGMANCNGCATPMESRIQLSKRSEAPAVDKTEYRSIIRSLRYLLHTRPHLSFSVGFLSRFMESPRHDHKVALKRVLRYLSATTGYGVQSRKRQSKIDWVFRQ
jgi:hypothetical protein